MTTRPRAGYLLREERNGHRQAGTFSQTAISGPVADQAAVHGLLNRVSDLGLVLISARQLGPD